MTLSREQAQSLTRLLHLLRPAWSEAGIYAALTKVTHLDAFEVTLAAIRAAADPKAQTPGIIPTKGSHWNEPEPKPTTQPRLTREERRARTCAECGRLDGCAPPTHPFVPLDHATRGRSDHAALARAELTQATTRLCPCGVLARDCAAHRENTATKENAA